MIYIYISRKTIYILEFYCFFFRSYANLMRAENMTSNRVSIVETWIHNFLNMHFILIIYY